MSQLWAMILAKCRMAGHQIAGVRHESKLKVGVITVAAIGLWFGAYFLFSAGFGFLIQFGGGGAGEFNFGDLLMSRMLGILALSVFMLLIFSNVLVAFSTMYRSREVAYLMQSPVPFESLFYMRFLESLAFSSWSLAYLGSPLMLAYGVRTEAPLVFYVANVVFFLPFVIIPACIGCLITMALVWVFPRLRMPVLAGIALGALIAFFMIIRYTIRRIRIAEDAVLPAFLDGTARMQSPFLPSHWAAQGVLSAAQWNVSASLFWLLLLLSTAMMLLWVCGRVAGRIFHPGWSYLAGQDRKREKPMGKGILGRVEQWARFLPDPYRALAVKDVKLFWRDATQWSQFVIFFGIMAVYIANLRNTSRFYEQEMWRSIIANLNVGSVSLILATLTSRFVFPLVSLEGRRFWIIGLAPLSFRQLVWQKFWLSVATTSVFTVGLAFLSGIMLRLDPIYFCLTVFSVAITNFGLAGLAVGLGALYPTFTEDNPARIVSGMGGTLNLLLSVGYITLVVGAQAVILQWRVLGRYADPVMFWYALAGVLVFISLLSAACVILPMRFGLKNLNDMEF